MKAAKGMIWATIFAAAFGVGRWSPPNIQTEAPREHPTQTSLPPEHPSHLLGSEYHHSAQSLYALLEKEIGLGILAAADWARSDPLAAISAIESIPQRAVRIRLRAAIMRAWVYVDQDAAIAHLKPVELSDEEMPAINATLELLGRIDPSAGLALLLHIEAGAEALFGEWARYAPEVASAQASELVDSPMRYSALGACAEQVMNSSGISAAVQWSQSLDLTQATRDWLDGRMSYLLLAESRKSALEAIASESISDGLRRELAQAILEQGPTDDTDFETTKKLLSLLTYPGEEISYFQNHFNLSQLAELISIAQKDPDGTYSTEFLIEKWASKDPDAAVTWTRELGDNSVRSVAITDLTRLLAVENPGILESFSGVGDAEAIGRGLAIISLNDQPSTLALLDDLHPITKSKALPEIIENWARRSPAEAAAYIEIMDATPGEVSSAKSALAAQWFSNQETEGDVVEWLDTQQGTAGSNEAFESLTRVWFDHDRVAASQWASSLAPGAEREAVAKKLASLLIGIDSEAAFHWAESLVDPESRTDLMDEALEAWKRYDPQANP